MRVRSQSYPGANGSAYSNSTNRQKSSSTGNSVGSTRVPKFLRCLYDMLYSQDSSIIGWSTDGASFQVHDIPRLETEVLPKYFKHGKFASFQRQLNNFGFRKWTKTQSNVCTFSHHHFEQCHPDQLVELIISQSMKQEPHSNSSAKLESSTSEPSRDFTNPVSKSASGKRKCEASSSDVGVKQARPTPLNSWLEMKDVESVCFGSSKFDFESKRSGKTDSMSMKSPLISSADPVFDLEVDPWGLMIDVAPLPWSTNSKLAMGGETPTTVTAPIGSAFDFAAHDMDSIFVDVNSCNADEDHRVDLRILNDFLVPEGLGVEDMNVGNGMNPWDCTSFPESKIKSEPHPTSIWMS